MEEGLRYDLTALNSKQKADAAKYDRLIGLFQSVEKDLFDY